MGWRFRRDSSEGAKDFGTAYQRGTTSRARSPVGMGLRCRHRAGARHQQRRLHRPRQIREAILASRGTRGVEGNYNFDQNGDGLRGYNIVKNDNGNIVFLKQIDFRE